jgi:hypothetical protein
MREAAISGIGCAGQHVFLRRIMQRIIHAGHHPSGIAKGRVIRNVFHALTINIYFTVAA